MDAADERRRYQRTPFDRAVFCYQDGVRLKVRPVDLSVGGVFLEVVESARLTKGASLGVVLDRQAGFAPPIYLFGTIVRHQKGPPEGVGLRWDKAVTTGRQAELVSALALLFAIEKEALAAHVEPGVGRMKACFQFEPFFRAFLARTRGHEEVPGEAQEGTTCGATGAIPPPRSDLRDPGAGPIGLSVSPAEVARMSPEVVPHERGVGSVWRLLPDVGDLAGQPEASSARGERSGAITSEIRKDSYYARAEIAAVMDVSGAKIDLRITGLTERGMLVESLVAPVDREGEFPVRFAVPTREGSLLVTATCRIRGLRSGRDGRAPGMELDLTRVDEGSHKGLLTRYVKWLHYSSLANG